jgi:cell division protein FtsA
MERVRIKHMLDKFKDLSRAAVSRATDVASKASDAASGKMKNSEDDQLIVALDIGTEFVKALVARANADGEMEIIGVGRSHQKLSDMQAGAISDIASVVQNCDEALNEAETQAGASARSAIIGIAGELVKGTTTTVRVSRKDASKQMDIEEMERIIKLVQSRAETRAKDQLALDLGGKDVELRLVNSALVSLEIDGYPVTNPIGFQGKDVVVQLYTAFAPMIHIGALERTAQELDLDLLAVAAEPFAVARGVIGDNQSANLNVILMDVGGGTTDIAVINDGGVQGTKMFGIGGRAYTRSVEREVGVSFDAAEKLKLALGTDQMPPQKAQAVQAALTKTVKVWIDGVELALSDFEQLDHLPHRLYLCGGGSSLQLLMEQLSQSEWYRALPFTRKPVVHHVRPEQVVGITDTTGKATDHTFITAMGLLRVGMDTLQFTGAGRESIRDKIDKMLRV